MRIASFNVENMFRRPKALNPATYEQNRPILEAYARLQNLLEKATYSDTDKTRIVELLEILGLKRSDASEWVILRRSRGQLVARKRDGSVTVTAGGRAEWIGWLELKREAVDEVATRNTARVIAGLGADVLAVIEAEDRPALDRFNRDVLATGFDDDRQAWRYRHVMLIDGNDDRGIDVGLMTRQAWPIAQMRSHVDDLTDDSEAVFSRDCPEYELDGPAGARLLVLANHFKSKGYGKPAISNARRTQQAQRVADIYRARRAEGTELIAVVGDLNDTPDSEPLAPLLHATDLKDISEHDSYTDDGRTGTYATGRDKIDYLLLSPALFARARAGGVDRSGVWRGPRVKNPWPMLDTITKPEQAASDHAAIWADIDL
ncbi:MAG: endonuclease/exonuclease/phosphatase family protein [Solirubrobacteraceae bacterium]